MSKITINYDEIKAMVEELQEYLNDVEDVKKTLKDDVQIIENQESPNVIKNAREVVNKFHKDIDDFSTKELKATLKGIHSGIEEVKNIDEEIAKKTREIKVEKE